MLEEREIALKKGIISPVWDNIQQTHNSYNQNLTHILTNFNKERDAMLVASHNRDSCNLALELVNSLNLGGSNVIFA